MRRIHLKKKRKRNNKINLLIIILIALIISIVVVFKFINKKLTPAILEYATVQTNKIATSVITKAVNNEVISQIDMNELFIVTNDMDGNPVSIDFNPIIVNKMIGMISENVHDYLKKLEFGDIESLGISNISTLASSKKLKEGVIYEIPSGIAFDNTILSNIGPKIPVKLNLVGDVSTKFKTDITNYGINNALIKLTIVVEVKEQIILPISTKQISVKSEIPVALKLMQGSVPHYYSNGANTPNINVTED